MMKAHLMKISIIKIINFLLKDFSMKIKIFSIKSQSKKLMSKSKNYKKEELNIKWVNRKTKKILKFKLIEIKNGNPYYLIWKEDLNVINAWEIKIILKTLLKIKKNNGLQVSV